MEGDFYFFPSYILFSLYPFPLLPIARARKPRRRADVSSV